MTAQNIVPARGDGDVVKAGVGPTVQLLKQKNQVLIIRLLASGLAAYA